MKISIKPVAAVNAHHQAHLPDPVAFGEYLKAKKAFAASPETVSIPSLNKGITIPRGSVTVVDVPDECSEEYLKTICADKSITIVKDAPPAVIVPPVKAPAPKAEAPKAEKK